MQVGGVGYPVAVTIRVENGWEFNPAVPSLMPFPEVVLEELFMIAETRG